MSAETPPTVNARKASTRYCDIISVKICQNICVYLCWKVTVKVLNSYDGK